MTLRATATAGQGQSAGVNNLSITVPTSGTGGTVVAGDVATIAVNTLTSSTVTLTTPSGWTLVSGPDPSTPAARSWVFRKTLIAGDIGAAVSLSLSGFVRAVAGMVVEANVTTTGVVFPTPVTDNTTADATPALPSAASVPAGADVLAVMARRNGAAGAATIGLPAEFGSAVLTVTTSYGSTPEATLVMGLLTAATTGTYGGTSGTSSPSTTGVDYVQALPSAQVDNTQQIPATGVGVAGAAPAPDLDVAVDAAGVGAGSADAGLASSSSPPIPAAAAGVGAGQVDPGTAVAIPAAGVGAAGPDVAVTATASPAIPAAAAGVGAAPAVVQADAALAIPAAAAGLGAAAAVSQSIYSWQFWDAAAGQWKPLTPLVRFHGTWVIVPVDVVPSGR